MPHDDASHPQTTEFHQDFYRHARLYAEAFSWRDIERECAFLEEVARKHLGRAPGSVLELAAGPAEHARYFGTREPMDAHALDLSTAMLEYAAEQARQQGANVSFHAADLRDFRVPVEIDLAFCLLDSISYLPDHRSFLRHLRCVADCLAPDGVYVIETVHPKEPLSGEKTTSTQWSVERGGRRIEVEFGRDDDPFDPVSQIQHTTVRLRESGDCEDFELVETCALRLYLYQELKLLVEASPGLRLVDTFGTLDSAVSLDDEEEAWRTVLVIQRHQQ